jgi:hypothetical protein
MSQDRQADLLYVIRDGGCRRQDVAQTYAAAIVYAPDAVEWATVNAAIIERWSVSGLSWIKSRAWKLAQAHPHYLAAGVSGAD